MIKFGDNTIRKVYFRERLIIAAYQGTTAVYEIPFNVKVKTTSVATEVFFRANGSWYYTDGTNSGSYLPNTPGIEVPVEPDTWVSFGFSDGVDNFFYFSAYSGHSGNEKNQTTIQAINLLDIGDIRTMKGAFVFLYEVNDIQISADLSKVTNFHWAFNGLKKATEFPQIDTSSGDNFQGCWNNNDMMLHYPEMDFSKATNILNMFSTNPALECIDGTLDFRNIGGTQACFANDTNLTQPPSTGSAVRDGNNALVGIWTNPGTCP